MSGSGLCLKINRFYSRELVAGNLQLIIITHIHNMYTYHYISWFINGSLVFTGCRSQKLGLSALFPLKPSRHPQWLTHGIPTGISEATQGPILNQQQEDRTDKVRSQLNAWTVQCVYIYIILYNMCIYLMYYIYIYVSLYYDYKLYCIRYVSLDYLY